MEHTSGATGSGVEGSGAPADGAHLLATSPIPYRKTAVADPLPLWKEFGEQRVIRYERGVVLTRRADIARLKLNREIRGEGGRGPTQGAERPLIPLDLDGLEHTRYRRLLDPLFSPRAVARLEPRIQKLSNSLIDGFIDRGEVELYEAFCVPLPSLTFLGLLGFPESDLPMLRRFKDLAIRAVTADMSADEARARLQERDAEGRRMYEYIDAALDERERSGPRDDLLSGFLTAEFGGDRLSRQEIHDIVYLLVIAGLDTVAATLSDMVEWLARHPDHQRRLVTDPAAIPLAVEELLRIQTPVVANTRYPTADVEVAPGEVVHPGEVIHVVYPTANLDEETFRDPLAVDFDRVSAHQHMSFGSGFHRCLGSHLARLELRVALETLHRRLERYRLVDDDPPRIENDFIRTVVHLPIRFERRAVTA